MRIGIDARLIHYRPGGTAEYTRHLVRELAGLDQTTHYAVLHHARARHTLVPGPNFRRVNIFTPSHHRLERWSLSVELLPRRLDLLHSPDSIPPWHGARRHVITIHDLHYLHYPQFMTAESRRYYQGQIARAVKMADHILVSSHSTLSDLCSLLNISGDKITVHMLGVHDAFQPLSKDTVAQARQRLNLPESYILFVGTFEPRKNIPGLLEAYALLLHERADIPPLVLAGRRGWLYEDIFARVDALEIADHVIWLENAAWEDLPAIYNGAAVLVLPSYYEGFGLTALEALACGTPVVAADRSSLPEVVGEAGLLVDPDSPAQIASAVSQLLDDSALCAQFRAAGLARAAIFTWRQTAETTLQVYRRVLS